MQEIMIVINEGPYGNEKAYNALRTAMNLQKKSQEVQVNVFLLDDAVTCAKSDQKTSKGFYNIERMLSSVMRKGGRVKT